MSTKLSSVGLFMPDAVYSVNHHKTIFKIDASHLGSKLVLHGRKIKEQNEMLCCPRRNVSLPSPGSHGIHILQSNHQDVHLYGVLKGSVNTCTQKVTIYVLKYRWKGYLVIVSFEKMGAKRMGCPKVQ